MRRLYLVPVVLFVAWLLFAPSNRASNALLIGDGYFQDANAPKAFEYYSQALALAPESWRTRLRMARLLARTRKFDLADQYYQAALQVAPDEPEVLEDAATFFLSRNQYPQAQALLRQILSERPANFEALFLLATLAEQQDQHASAQRWLRKILEHNPDHYEALWQLAQVQSKTSQAEAQVSLERMLRSGPPAARRRKALLLLGQLQLRTGQKSQGLATLTTLIQTQPDTDEGRQAKELIEQGD